MTIHRQDLTVASYVATTLATYHELCLLDLLIPEGYYARLNSVELALGAIQQGGVYAGYGSMWAWLQSDDGPGSIKSYPSLGQMNRAVAWAPVLNGLGSDGAASIDMNPMLVPMEHPYLVRTASLFLQKSQTLVATSMNIGGTVIVDYDLKKLTSGVSVIIASR